MFFSKKNTSERLDLESKLKTITKERDELLTEVADNTYWKKVALRDLELKMNESFDLKTIDLSRKNTSLTTSCEVYKKENEILKNAFKELAFDVKDTKDIISKLIEGISTKAEFKIIK